MSPAASAHAHSQIVLLERTSPEPPLTEPTTGREERSGSALGAFVTTELLVAYEPVGPIGDECASSADASPTSALVLSAAAALEDDPDRELPPRGMRDEGFAGRGAAAFEEVDIGSAAEVTTLCRRHPVTATPSKRTDKGTIASRAQTRLEYMQIRNLRRC